MNVSLWLNLTLDILPMSEKYYFYFEEKSTRSEAFRREMQFKNGKTRKATIERLIKFFPQAKCQGFNSHNNLCSSR